MRTLSTKKLQAVVAGIQKLYPVKYADSSWDNTGLLVDASSEDEKAGEDSTARVLLTIDLTRAVAEEAIKGGANVILAYHPFIFKGLKAIGRGDPQQRSLIELIQHGVSVYCPHTAVDAARGGVNDWLADGITDEGLNLAAKSVIEPSADDDEGVGMGRIVELKQAISLTQAIAKVKHSLRLEHVQVASNGMAHADDASIHTVAICAGSGAGVFRNVAADLYYTGEMSHHEALFYKECGAHVIACNHSNTERGFLPVLKQQLEAQFAASGDAVAVSISETDRDPYVVI